MRKNNKQKNNTPPPFRFIESQSELEAFAASLDHEKMVAVDLEADSMYHFKEKVCLLQMATTKDNVIIDPLKIPDMSCLKKMFADPDIQKVFHGADYDIRSLYRDFEIDVNNLFDTQMASRFLGFEGTGLDAVIRKEFEVRLDKKYQKKDWSQRPLPKEMLEYAAGDAIYLIPLAKRFQKALKEKKRLEWVEEECLLLAKVRAAMNNGEPLFLRFKGAGRLKPRQLAVLESILQLRQAIAEKKDRPPFKIFSNKSMLGIVHTSPVTLRHLEDSEALSRKQLNMYGSRIIRRVTQALKLPKEELPAYPRRSSPSLSPLVPERMKWLKMWRDDQIQQHQIDPALICNKALMTAIADKKPRNRQELSEISEMRTWQQKAFGDEIIRVLNKNLSGGKKTAKQRRR